MSLQFYVAQLRELEKQLRVAKNNFNQSVNEKRKIERQIQNIQRQVFIELEKQKVLDDKG